MGGMSWAQNLAQKKCSIYELVYCLSQIHSFILFLYLSSTSPLSSPLLMPQAPEMLSVAVQSPECEALLGVFGCEQGQWQWNSLTQTGLPHVHRNGKQWRTGKKTCGHIWSTSILSGELARVVPTYEHERTLPYFLLWISQCGIHLKELIS